MKLNFTRACLMECMHCVETWGSLYSGHNCAKRCLESSGGSIDPVCQSGRNIGKRVADKSSKVPCLNQCAICSHRLFVVLYDEETCRHVCEERDGTFVDYACVAFLVL
ncbi:hypothetical protein CHS0354_023045 [Potamilus streckersoni]|uniref:Uncharacterized protein n=1 Tax=Potamilus streckersoni TaxID=2493646 RepID=A0AAE0RWE3_9BIVA|nr:hypothetical protein CHS0354_023045 [Potamilus streckersoni]